MKYKHWILVLTTLLIISCSEGKNTKYKDMSHLEKPPTMPIIEKPEVLVEENDEADGKGLGDSVVYIDSELTPVIKIKKTFDRSWSIIEQALQLNEIEISDKNREKGVFYVTFDPDEQSDSSLIDAMTFFLFKDEYAEASYKLTVAWQESDSEVKVQPVDSEEDDDLLDDDGDDFEGAIDKGTILLKTLYKTIRDDFPVN